MNLTFPPQLYRREDDENAKLSKYNAIAGSLLYCFANFLVLHSRCTN